MVRGRGGRNRYLGESRTKHTTHAPYAHTYTPTLLEYSSTNDAGSSGLMGAGMWEADMAATDAEMAAWDWGDRKE